MKKKKGGKISERKEWEKAWRSKKKIRKDVK